MSIADESLGSDVPVVRFVDDNTKETISITLVNNDTKKDECVCIVDSQQTLIATIAQELVDMNDIKTDENWPQFTYNGNVIGPDDFFQSLFKFGMKDGDKIYVTGLPSLILINFIDECGELTTIQAKSNDELWKVMKEYSAQKEIYSPISHYLCFSWIYKGKQLREIRSTLLELGITSTDVIYFSLNTIITKTEIDNRISNISMETFVESIDPDYFVGQSVRSVHGNNGRVRAADSSDQTWMIEIASTMCVYKERDLILGLQRFYDNNGVLHDIREYLKNMIEKKVSDMLRLTEEGGKLHEEVKVDNETKLLISGATRKLLMTHLKLEQDIDESLILVSKVKEQLQLEEDESLDKMHDILTKQMINSTEVKKKLMATYKVNKPMLKVGDSVYAVNSRNSWEPGEITSFSEDKDIDGYGPRRLYSILFESGKEDDILDGEVISYDEYAHTMYTDWIGIQHVLDKDASDAWAQEQGWYTVNVFGVDEPFANVYDAIRLYDANAICCKKGDVEESELNYPDEEKMIFTISSQAKYAPYMERFIESQRLSIRLMIAQERLANSSLDPIFEVLKNCILPNNYSWISFGSLKLGLGWRWKEALASCMDNVNVELTINNFLEFALFLQSVEAHTSIHQICRFFIGTEGNLSDFLSRVPTFGAAYSISSSLDRMIEYLQTNKPDNADDFMFIRCRDGNDMLRRLVAARIRPFKDFLTNYAADKDTSVKSLRVKHNDKTLFLSGIGKKTPEKLGFNEGEILDITIMQSTPTKTTTKEEPKQQSSKGKNNKKKKKHKKSKKKRPVQIAPPEDEEEKAKKKWMFSLYRVFAEAEPTFKEIRQRLNALNLERTKPKQRTSPSKSQSAVEVVDNPLDDSQLGGKAGKTQFIIQVGEVSNLYKTTKSSSAGRGRRQDDIMIDLHGLTAEEAVYRLDKHLSDWIETAMKGTYPFVIPVKIVCGGGSQILAEVVENWIKQNDNVANAPKNMYS